MEYRWSAVVVAFGLIACSGTSPTTDDTPTDPEPTTVAQDRPAKTPCERPAFLDAYGPLVTIAGTGKHGRKDLNGWKPVFEGGPAIDAELSRPHIAMADDSGAIYIADKDAHAVRKIDVDGAITTIAGTSIRGDDGDAAGPANQRKLAHPNGLWVRGDGTLYIVDLDSDAIRRVDTKGQMTTIVRPEQGIPIGRGLWVADDESRIVIAAGSKILEWTPDGGASVIADGFRQLGNLFRQSNGELLVADRGGSRVYRVAPGGAKTVIAGGGERSDDCAPAVELALPGVRAVWPHADGGYFVGTHSGSSVWYIDAGGYGHRFLDGDDGIDEVRAITIGPDGRLIITDDDAGFIRVMSPSGAD